MIDSNDRGLLPGIRASLQAKVERLLQRPLVARVVDSRAEGAAANDDALPEIFRELLAAVEEFEPELTEAHRLSPWREDSLDGTCTVSISIDYDDLWRGAEREVLDAVAGTVENFVAFLTDEQRLLLERSPREFLALDPSPETAELVSFRKEVVGGSVRVVELVLAEPPRSTTSIRHIAVIPNLIPLERQLSALTTLAFAPEDGVLAPLRRLVGLPVAEIGGEPPAPAAPQFTDRLDDFQQECVVKALSTPHFSVIQGPPGSGKTTVIATLIRHTLDRGGRILVVSPTHVAVDNVVEKLASSDAAPSGTSDDFEGRTLPVRYAARPKKLLEGAAPYWIGPKKQRREATIARRLEERLRRTNPLARQLYDHMDPKAHGFPPLTQAVAGEQGVICGTPIGILSYDVVKHAGPGHFDLLIVDEVSKMTLPEFLAVAVKARRWVLVGDPEQLPPFNNAEENGVTVDDVLDAHLELVCSVGSVVEREKPELRQDVRLVVVASDARRVATGIECHLAGVQLDGAPAVSVFADGPGVGVVVCEPAELDAAVAYLSPARGRDLSHNPRYPGSVHILVERGLRVQRPEVASGSRLVESRMRAQARLFDTAFSVYHAQPWQRRADQSLLVVRFRRGLDKYLPSVEALAALAGKGQVGPHHVEERAGLVGQLAERYAINAISVYDWLTGIPTRDFDTEPLCGLSAIADATAALRADVAPYVGTLRRQYRMHASLSVVPRDLFYFGEALHDGRPNARPGCRVQLVQVRHDGPAGETNPCEARAVCGVLSRLNASGAGAGARRQRILVITPYRAQERELARAIDAVRGGLEHIDVEVCTLDRCQGREAEYVFISLVRSRSTPFLDAPKRWNVALTRAMEGLFIFGDVNAYLREADQARKYVARNEWAQQPRMSMLARILEAYSRQAATHASRRLAR